MATLHSFEIMIDKFNVYGICKPKLSNKFLPYWKLMQASEVLTWPKFDAMALSS
jgi:hypothetical protein